MDLNTQYKIFNNELLHKYIRENSYWYKILNRNPLLLNQMTQEMKDRYKLNTSDKIEKLSERLSLVESILKVLE